MTAKLIMTLDGAILREYPITKDSFGIGRRHGNDVQVNDMTISGRHVLLTTIGIDTFVEDLGTTNGTMVNGNYVSKLLLMHGDIIQVGAHQFTYFTQEDMDYEPTMFIKAEVDETRMINPGKPLSDELKGMPLGAAKLLNGPCANVVMEMRKPVNTIGFKGKTLASIARGLEGYTIAIYQGKSPISDKDIPLLNGKPITDEVTKLSEHDIIEISRFQMEFIYVN
ncbi:MAG: FHA domain-containing protein [Gammaproteobacteria bacterium]|nr:FHA domain-containing protein [Gammaproteobacteria bacterium]